MFDASLKLKLDIKTVYSSVFEANQSWLDWKETL